METVTEPGKVRGIKVTLGSQGYIIPPLNLVGFEQHEPEIEKLAKMESLKISEKLRIICGIALSAIQRNYPEITLDFLKQWIDLGNMEEVFMAVMSQSGMRPAKPGEPTERESTGPLSTLGFAPLLDGDGTTSALN